METETIDSGMEKCVHFFEQLDRDNLSQLDSIYARNARFTDPFNDVRGIGAIRSVFEDMYERCATVKFIVNETVLKSDIAYIRWRFHYSTRRRVTDHRSIDGVSRLVFDDKGFVTEHTDYWDAARQVYERLPFIGTIIRRIRNRVSVAITT